MYAPNLSINLCKKKKKRNKEAIPKYKLIEGSSLPYSFVNSLNPVMFHFLASVVSSLATYMPNFKVLHIHIVFLVL